MYIHLRKEVYTSLKRGKTYLLKPDGEQPIRGCPQHSGVRARVRLWGIGSPEQIKDFCFS